MSKKYLNKTYFVKCRKCGLLEARENYYSYICKNCKTPSLYGRGWDRANKLARLRDKVCQICGVDKRLQVHHKDGNIKNSNLDNLILYCQSCHQSQHRTNFKEIKDLRIGKYGTRLIYA